MDDLGRETKEGVCGKLNEAVGVRDIPRCLRPSPEPAAPPIRQLPPATIARVLGLLSSRIHPGQLFPLHGFPVNRQIEPS